jgi:hypothetical protein
LAIIGIGALADIGLTTGIILLLSFIVVISFIISLAKTRIAASRDGQFTAYIGEVEQHDLTRQYSEASESFRKKIYGVLLRKHGKDLNVLMRCLIKPKYIDECQLPIAK